MSAELLSALRARGVRLWAEHGALNYDAPAGVMTDELLERLRAHKPELLALLASAEPSAPCTTCAGGHYYQLAGVWRCSWCDPTDQTPAATLTVAGGRLRCGEPQDPYAVIHAAVAGLPITAAEFRAWCAREDLADIARGLIPVHTVRAYARELVRQGPRDLGATAYGAARVQTYRAA